MKNKSKVESHKIIILNEQCNEDCVFCSGAERREMTDFEIKNEILNASRAVVFEGGEPTLSNGLLPWIKFAKNRGVKEIVLVTNGIMLSQRNFAKKLLDGGVTLFNVSFHSHRASLYNALTRREVYSLAIKGIKNLVELGAAEKTRLTCVITKANYRFLPDYIKWVKNNFPDIFYVAVNYVKILGRVKSGPEKYVPRFNAVRPYLLRAFEIAKESDIKVLVDGFPLCLMEDYPEYNEDSQKFTVTRDFVFMGEKTKTQKCKNCSLSSLCGGARRDYLKLYGDKELKPSSKNLNEVALKLSKI